MVIGETSFYLRGFGLIAAGGLFWLLYFDLKDRRHPEPRRLLLTAVLLGMGAAAAALGVFRLGRLVGLSLEPEASPGYTVLFCLFLIGPVEEGMKFLFAHRSAFQWRAFDEPIDGLVYASALAIGFACLENLLYVPILGGKDLLARALTSPLTHSLFAAIWGLGLSLAKFTTHTRRGRVLWLGLPLLGSMLLHGLYDAVLLAWNATLAASGVVLLLCLVLLRTLRRLPQTSRRASVPKHPAAARPPLR